MGEVTLKKKICSVRFRLSVCACVWEMYRSEFLNFTHDVGSYILIFLGFFSNQTEIQRINPPTMDAKKTPISVRAPPGCCFFTIIGIETVQCMRRVRRINFLNILFKKRTTPHLDFHSYFIVCTWCSCEWGEMQLTKLRLRDDRGQTNHAHSPVGIMTSLGLIQEVKNINNLHILQSRRAY